MSLSPDARYVTCDGTDCQARADVPIALRPILSHPKTTERVDGWLFAARHGEWRHFCPDCLALYLESSDKPLRANG